MVEWLSGQGAVPGEVDGLIDTLTELRLLDDQKFAEQFAAVRFVVLARDRRRDFSVAP